MGGVQAVFVAKIKKYLGTFCRWVGACFENSFFFRKYPLKEDKVFSESTSERSDSGDKKMQSFEKF